MSAETPRPPELRAVDAAWRLMASGVAAPSVALIASEGAMSKGGLQRYYPHRDDLIALVADRAVHAGPLAAEDAEATAWARVWASLRAAAADGSPLCDRLDALEAASVHPTRLRALEHLLFAQGEGDRRLFPRRIA